MQKQFLLNTLLLIGAICLSTRGIAQTQQMQVTTVNPIEQSHNIDNRHSTTATATQSDVHLTNRPSAYTAHSQEDSLEEMD